MSLPGYTLAFGTTGLFLLQWYPSWAVVPPQYSQFQAAWFLTAPQRAAYLAQLQVDDPGVNYIETNLVF